MIKLYRCVFAVCCGLLASCSTTNSIPIYSVDEVELSALISTQLDQQAARLKLAGLPARFTSTQVLTDITPQGVQVQLQSQLSIQLGLVELPVGVTLELMTSPVYDATVHGVRLQDFRVVRADVQAAGYSGRMKPVSQALQQQMALWLARQPVFVLDERKATQRLLMTMPLQLRLEADRMVLSPAYGSQSQTQ